MQRTETHTLAASKTFVLIALCFVTSGTIQGCGKANSASSDDAALRKEFKKPHSLSDVPPDRRAMVEGILQAQKQGKAPQAPKVGPAR